MPATTTLPDLWIFAVVLFVLFVVVPAAIVMVFYRKANALRSRSAKTADQPAATQGAGVEREIPVGEEAQLEKLREAEKLRGYVQSLDTVSAGFRAVYRVLLYGVLILGIAVIVFIFIASRGDANAPFLRFWFGVLFLGFLLWVLRQLSSLRHRESESDLSDMPEVFFKKDKELDQDTGATRASLEFGMKPRGSATESGRPDFSWSFGTKFSSLPAEDEPDDAAVAKADDHLRQGQGWEAICRQVHPAYSQWESARQRFYQEYLKGLVALRRAKQGQNPSWD